IGKLASLVLIIVAGVVLLIVSGASSNLSQIDQITQNGQKIVPTLTTTGFVMAIVSAFYAFTGFESVASGSDDMKNPGKNLPRAIPLAIIVIAVIDRKSTRLNSSHVSISYAVFCLKKKKKNRRI